jgi:hypothetical protein
MRRPVETVFQIQAMNRRAAHDPFEGLPPQPLPRWGVLGWCFVVFIGIGIILVTVPMLQEQMDERLYAKFRLWPQADFLPPSHPNDGLRAACAAFQLKQYPKALALFQSDTSDLFLEEKKFYAALCLLESSATKAAETALLPLAQGQHPLRHEAQWYRALCRLRLHDRPGCRLLLTPELEHSLGRIGAEKVVLLRMKL